MDDYQINEVRQILFDLQFSTGPYANVGGSFEKREQALRDILSVID